MIQMGRHLILATVSLAAISLLSVNVIPNCHVGGLIAEQKDCKLHLDNSKCASCVGRNTLSVINGVGRSHMEKWICLTN